MKREKLIAFRGNRTQSEMGKIYGVSYQAWGQWESGAKTPTVDKMKLIEQDSGIPMEEIFFDKFSNLKLRDRTTHV